MKPCPNCGMTEKSDLTVSDADDFQGLCPCGVCGPFGTNHEDGEKKWDALPRREDAAELVEQLKYTIEVAELARDRALYYGKYTVRLGGSNMNEGQFLAVTDGRIEKARAALAKWGK